MCEEDGMEEWKECRLKDIVEINPTESLKKGTVAKKIGMDVLQPYCRAIPSFSFEPYTGGTKFKNGDTIMARITPCLENGKTAMVNILDDNEIGFGSTEYIVFREKNNITDPYFIYYLVTSDCIRNPAIKSMVGSSGRQRVQTDVVANLSIKLPPLPTQQKIAAILSSLDDKIELNNKINTNLEQQAQALFKNWFVDFEPFGGKMPEGWKVGVISDFGNVICGKTPSTKIKDYYGDEIPFITIPDMHNSVYACYTERYLSVKGAQSQESKNLPPNSICVSCIATPGLVVLTDRISQTNQQINSIVPNENVSLYYIYLTLKNLSETIKMLGSSGSTTSNLNKEQFSKIQITIPNNEVMKKFESFVQPMFEKIRSLQKEDYKLVTIRDTLLPKLMNEEIEV